MILSPVSVGNGAYVVHSQLAKKLPNYRLVPYNPKRTFFPPLLYPLGRGFKPKLIHAPLDYAWFHAQRSVPLVATLHNYVLDQAFQPYGSSLQKLHWKNDLRYFSFLAARRADVLTAVSHFTAELAKTDLGINKPVKIIYNGIDEQLFFPKKRVVRDEINVLFSGNLSLRKGAQWLLPIIQRLDKRIVIYYTSGLRETSSLVAHPRLRPLGQISYEKMPELYREMDILLFPSVREGHSLAVLEAMASGLPVVGWNTSSLSEVVTNGKGGFLCPLEDIAAFASSIQTLADNHTLCQQMGEFNRVVVEQQFTLKRMLTDYQELFDLSCQK